MIRRWDRILTRGRVGLSRDDSVGIGEDRGIWELGMSIRRREDVQR